jgi:hypothetical protein
MKRQNLRIMLLAVLIGTFAALAGLPVSASAHETRTVAGKYKFVVGFLSEPAITDQPNGIDLTITSATTGEPVLGAEKSLKAQIIFGAESEDVQLAPRFNLPGKYAGNVIPTKAGTWKFHFTGKLNDDNIDESFTSGPGRFNDVASAQSLQFPVKAPPLAELSAQSSTAQTGAANAQVLAWIGIIAGAAGAAVGAVGIVVAAVALTTLRRIHAQTPARLDPKLL